MALEGPTRILEVESSFEDHPKLSLLALLAHDLERTSGGGWYDLTAKLSGFQPARIRPMSRGVAPRASRAISRRSIETLASPASIRAKRD